MRVLAVVGLVLFVFLLAQPAVSQVPDDKLIVPGQRIGKWTLDITISALEEMNGPRKGIPPHPNVGLSPWAGFTSPTYEHLWIPQTCLYALTHGRDSRKVIALGIPYPVHRSDQICTAAEAYRTAKGPLHTLDALEAAYGKAATLWVPGVRAHGGSLAIYDKIGLAVWLFGRANLTGGFLVFRPGTAKSIWKY